MATLGTVTASSFHDAAPNVQALVTMSTYADLLRPPSVANAQLLTRTKEIEAATSHGQHVLTCSFSH